MGKTCAVIDCEGESSTKPISFHKVPNGKTKPSWLKFLAEANKKWAWVPVERMYICSAHFELQYVNTGAAGRCRIHENGFPTIVKGHCLPEMIEEKSCYEVSSSQIELMNVDILKQELQQKDDTIQLLQQKLQDVQAQLSTSRHNLKVANQKLSRHEEVRKRKLLQETESAKKIKIDDDALLDALNERIESPELKEIVKRSMRNNIHAPYTDTLKEFCYRLHYYAGKGYNMLRDRFSKFLPTQKSFQRWTSHIESKPGFLSESLAFLKKTNETSPGKVYYALSVDEIHIRKQIIHKDDGFVGYVDYGGITENVDSNKVATAALFVLATSINGKVKVPICYILTNGLKSTVLAEVLKMALKKLDEAKCVVLSITFDGLQSNFRAMEHLGADLNVFSSTFQPFIKHENKMDDIHIISDVCHMMKLFRNLFKKYGNMKNYKGETIKWVHIHRLHQLQEQEGLKAANKLTSRHINFEFQKMKTKLCLQVMSNSVAVAISLCRKLCLVGFEDSRATEEFLLFINMLFDILNSKYGGSGSKAPLRQQKMAELSPFLSMIKFYLLTLTVNEKGVDVFLVKCRKGTAIRGLIITINSIEKIMADVVGKPNHYLKYLPTYKLSQDHIELFFSTIRARSGRNNNPNAVQLSHCVKSILCMKAKCIVSGNCTDLEEEESTRVCAFKSITTIMDEADECCFEESSDPFDGDLPHLSIFVDNIVAYIAGHIGMRLSSNLSCTHCICNLIACEDDLKKYKEEFQLLVEKDRGGLFYPSSYLMDVCSLSEKLTRQYELCGLTTFSKDFLQKSIISQWNERKHQVGTTNCEHSEDMIKLVVSLYLKIRLHHAAKQKSLEIAPATIRSINTKSYIFNGN